MAVMAPVPGRGGCCPLIHFSELNAHVASVTAESWKDTEKVSAAPARDGVQDAPTGDTECVMLESY